jgi:hypothetical protein
MSRKNKRRPVRSATQSEPIEVEDSSLLSDADWAAINALRRIAEQGGKRAFLKACEKLAVDEPIRYATILAAMHPNKFHAKALDAMAELGVTLDDLSAMTQKKKNLQ